MTTGAHGLNICVCTPTGMVFRDLPADSLRLSTVEGEIEILPGHVPLVSLLPTQEGRFCITNGNEVKEYLFDGGIVEVINNKVGLLIKHIHRTQA